MRNRLNRGTLEGVHEGTRVFVVLPEDSPESNRRDTERDTERAALEAHIATLQAALESERESSRELRRIVAGLVQRVPELEAPAESSSAAPGDTEAPAEQQGRGQPQFTTP